MQISNDEFETKGRLVTRLIPCGTQVYEFEFPLRTFRDVAVTADGLHLLVTSIDGMKVNKCDLLHFLNQRFLLICQHQFYIC